MNELRGLLSAAIPDLSDPDDRVAAVRDRATRLRRRRSILASAAVLVIAALPFVLRGEPVEPVTLGAVPACPSYTESLPKPGPGADGEVVPEGVVRATMCIYRPSLGSWQTEVATIEGDVSGVVTALNALPSHEARGEGCFMMLRPQYRMVFEYPDGSDHTVVFAMNCGVVESGDVVRSGDITEALDAFAESYRARGGTFPAPPWKW